MALPTFEQLIQLVPIGFAIGAVGTLVGLGGGFALMPVLLLLYKLDPASARAVSLFVALCNSGTATIAQRRQRRVDWTMGLVIGTCAVPAGFVGREVGNLFGAGLFKSVIGAVLLASAILLVLRPLMKRSDGIVSEAPGRGVLTRDITLSDGRTARYHFNVPVMVVSSILMGFYTGVTGLAGGTVFLPFMILLMGIPVTVAAATSLFAMLFTTLSLTVLNLAEGVVKFDYAIPLAVGAIGGAILGAWLAGRVRGGVVRWFLAVILAAVALRMLLFR